MGILNRLVESSEGRKLLNQELLITRVTERLLEVMEEKGVSQKHLAKTLGIKPPRVSKMLSGNANITLRTLADLATALDVDVHFSIDGEIFSRLVQVEKRLTKMERAADEASAFREFRTLREQTERKINEKRKSGQLVASF